MRPAARWKNISSFVVVATTPSQNLPSSSDADERRRRRVRLAASPSSRGGGGVAESAQTGDGDGGDDGAAAVEAADVDAASSSASLDDDDDDDDNLKTRRRRLRLRNLLRRVRGLDALSPEELTVAEMRREEDAKEKRRRKKKRAPKRATSLTPPRDAYDALRGEFDKAKLRAFFKSRPGQIAARLAVVLRVGTRLVRLWRREEKLPAIERTRSAQLRDALSGLGPVFVKIGQTLSQRPDLIGDEAADALKALQARTVLLTPVPIRPRSRCELHSLRTSPSRVVFLLFSPPTPRDSN
jgi:hypothetical protein